MATKAEDLGTFDTIDASVVCSKLKGTSGGVFSVVDSIDNENLWEGRNNRFNLLNLRLWLFSEFYEQLNEPDYADDTWHIIYLEDQDYDEEEEFEIRQLAGVSPNKVRIMGRI